MDFYLVRAEVRRLGKKNLFKTLMDQRESKCLLKGLCSYQFEYKGYRFCISEVLGEGCEFQRLKKLEEGAHGTPGALISEEKVDIPLFDWKQSLSYNFE